MFFTRVALRVHDRMMLSDVDSVVTRARMFQHKPDGQVTIMMMQDAAGVPIPTMQDPVHYPHGTKFLAPGTLQVPFAHLVCDSF